MELIEMDKDSMPSHVEALPYTLAVWLEEEVVSLNDEPGWFCNLTNENGQALEDDLGPFPTKENAIWAGKAVYHILCANTQVIETLMRDPHAYY